ncbi:cupin domain-containing protein [Methylobacterium sp. J-068]|uniref:cupin domain-containing protein n=1 Tax=Methylobacterium sp. J-068 TaxID=2836649 RepID=UPI001FB8A824|nr:cupin domain-containing protein [Methylobacterium sp. J-068]MCJ2035556.1 cupin domain-containing protein [Methylobacterium sp. J-068]
MTQAADGSLIAVADEIETSGIKLPGATPDGIEAQLLNMDAARGVVATIIHIKPGADIPAHFHRNGAEAHYVLEGDLVDAGRSLGPGTYLTHAAGIVHGPHGSVHGCKVLTIQATEVGSQGYDFNLADTGESPKPPADASTDPMPARGTTPPDMALEEVPTDDRPETERLGPTDDNPTNPTTG